MQKVFLILGFFVIGALIYYTNVSINQSIEVGVKNAMLKAQNQAIKENALHAQSIAHYNKHESAKIEQNFAQMYDELKPQENTLKEIENALEVFFANPPS